jgi:hypothetical protein
MQNCQFVLLFFVGVKLWLHIKGGTQAKVVHEHGTWEDMWTQEERSTVIGCWRKLHNEEHNGFNHQVVSG